MERVCFLGRVRAERLAEYRERHEQVWPEMLDALNGLPPDEGFRRIAEGFHLD